MRLNFSITIGSYTDLGNNKFYFHAVSFKYTEYMYLGTILIHTK